ncbi:MAG: MFS transporter [Acidimicrobiales bacterium]
MTSATTDKLPERALRWLVVGVGASGLGTGLGVVAFPLLALRMTTNPLLISGIAVAGGLPWLLVALPAGALVDHAERKRLVLFVELLRALVVAAVALGAATGQLPFAALYVAAFLVGTGETIVSAVSRVSVPLVVERAGRARANGVVAAAQGAGQQLAGPAIGGALFAVARSLPFLSDAACYVASGFLQRAGTPLVEATGLGSGRDAVSGVGIWSDVASGMRWFVQSASLRTLAAVVGSLAFCQSMVLSVLVLYATDVLHLGATGYGLLVAVPAVADIATNLLAHRVYDRLGGSRTLLLSGVTAGGAYILLGATSALVVAGAALVLETIATAAGNVANVTMRQELIPRERFGLVNNAMRMCIMGLVPLGAVVAGLLTKGLGTRPTFLVAGALQLLVLVVSRRALESVLEQGSPHAPPVA